MSVGKPENCYFFMCLVIILEKGTNQTTEQPNYNKLKTIRIKKSQVIRVECYPKKETKISYISPYFFFFPFLFLIY